MLRAFHLSSRRFVKKKRFLLIMEGT
jgi:hypothetical protein